MPQVQVGNRKRAYPPIEGLLAQLGVSDLDEEVCSSGKAL